MAEKAGLERKVTLAFLNEECLEYHLVVSLQEEHKATGRGEGEGGIHAPPRAAHRAAVVNQQTQTWADVVFIFLGVSLDAACVLKMAGVEKERKEEGWQGHRRVAPGPS